MKNKKFFEVLTYVVTRDLAKFGAIREITRDEAYHLNLEIS